MQIKIKRVQIGVNEDGVPITAPETQPPQNYASCEIKESEYVYTVADKEQQGAAASGG